MQATTLVFKIATRVQGREESEAGTDPNQVNLSACSWPHHKQQEQPSTEQSSISQNIESPAREITLRRKLLQNTWRGQTLCRPLNSPALSTSDRNHRGNMKRASRSKSRGQETRQEHEGVLIEQHYTPDTVGQSSIAFLFQLCHAADARWPKDRLVSTKHCSVLLGLKPYQPNYRKKGSEPLSSSAPLSNLALRGHTTAMPQSAPNPNKMHNVAV